MPRARGLKHLLMADNKGFISDQSAVKPIENSCIEEKNMEFSVDGKRRVRRLGLNVEDNGKFINPVGTPVNTEARGSYFWEAAGGEGSLSFHVFQLGQYLYFMEDVDSPLSQGLKTFTVDLDGAKESYATTTDVQNTEIDFSDGNGVLFITSTNMNPQFIEYDPVLDTINMTEILLRVRDLQGLDDGLNTDARPGSLSENHEYNLKNQGWGQKRKRKSDNASVEPITEFFTVNSKYPSNADNVTLGVVDNGSGDLRFDAASILDITFGNTPAPKGHFIIDPFNIEYENLRLGTSFGSGIFGLGISRSGGVGAGTGSPVTTSPFPSIGFNLP